jgi:hypothetical protein
LLWLDEDKGDPGSCDYAKGDSWRSCGLW